MRALSPDPSALLATLGIQEGRDLEFKSARGGMPKSLWETYSAMANTDGGMIVLGIEPDGRVNGLVDPARTRRDFWNTVNNRGKISTNLLTDADVVEHSEVRETVLAISVPRATRQQRPVYVGQNPLTGTYRRNYEGDYHCTEEEVGRMLADRSDEPADSRILEGYSLADLDQPSLQQYRQRFSSRTPTHPWLSEDEIGFLRKVGGWRTDRTTGKDGLTVSGLLMFGSDDAIREAVPEYHIDYRERLSDDPNVRWTDRLTMDGTWPANLFQFFSRVVRKLSQDLKLPFQLEADLLRQGETIVHEAIREALVNALIHADYRGQGGVVVEKYRDRFEISNPGTLLVSFEQLLRGGVSECRNKSLQTMFLMIGAAEKAGSGIDKILAGWRSQHWRWPSIKEQMQPDRVRLYLPMLSLMPEESLAKLRELYDRSFESLNEYEVQALVTADVEGEVTNSRLRQITDQHASDLTKMLQGLASKGFLVQDGQGRWTRYRLKGSQVRETTGSARSQGDSAQLGGDSLHIAGDSLHKGWDSSQMLDELQEEWQERLRAIGEPARSSRRLKPDVTQRVIAELCSGLFLTANHLAELMNRSPQALRSRFLREMVSEGLLRLRYPDKPNRPDQAYTRTEQG